MVSVSPYALGKLAKLESHSTISSCDSFASFVPNSLPGVSIIRRMHINHETTLNFGWSENLTSREISNTEINVWAKLLKI